MDSGRKKLSFVVTPDIEAILDREKKEWFYDRSRSYMIRELVMAGLRALKEGLNHAYRETALYHNR